MSESKTPCAQALGKAFINMPAPEWEAVAVMPNGEFKTLKLSDYQGRYLVLFFYPLDFTFVCPSEICSFSDAAKTFREAGCEVVACSVDSEFTHLSWTQVPRNKGGLGSVDIPLLADVKRQMCRDYGVLLEEGFSLRGLFIIDDKGKIRHITKNDPPVGRSVEETLRLVQAYQHTDKFGEVCPASWKPGSKTIKPDPKGKIEYFEAVNK